MKHGNLFQPDRNRLILGICIGLVGLATLIWYGGWQIGLGVFLMIWGNNLDD